MFQGLCDVLEYLGGLGGGSVSARGQAHQTYHSAAGCGASVGVLALTSLFSHYKREINAGFGSFLFLGQLCFLCLFLHTTPTEHILKVCTTIIIFLKPWLCFYAS